MKETSKEAILEAEKEEIIRKRIEKEADEYILPAYYTEMATDFESRIKPAIECALEIIMKDGLNEPDKEKLIEMLGGHNLPYSLRFEAIKKIEPELSKEELKRIETGINSKKGFLEEYLKKYEES